MKNHIKVNGQILQTNKKWSHLKQSQQTWIYDVTREEYEKYVTQYKKLPRDKGRDEVIQAVAERVCDRGIWIPGYILESTLCKYIAKLNRRSCIDVSEQGIVTLSELPVEEREGYKPPKPLIPFSELPDDIKEQLLAKLSKQILQYINQTNRIPPKKVMDNHIKMILSPYNSKQKKKGYCKVKCDNTLISAYENMANDIIGTICNEQN